MIVVAIIGVLAGIAIPNFMKAGTTARRNACIRNLQEIDGANRTYILEHSLGESDPAPTFEQIAPYLGRKKTGAVVNVDIKCPAGGSYSQGATAGDSPTCSKADTEGHKLD